MGLSFSLIEDGKHQILLRRGLWDVAAIRRIHGPLSYRCPGNIHPARSLHDAGAFARLSAISGTIRTLLGVMLSTGHKPHVFPSAPTRPESARYAVDKAHAKTTHRRPE